MRENTEKKKKGEKKESSSCVQRDPAGIEENLILA